MNMLETISKLAGDLADLDERVEKLERTVMRLQDLVMTPADIPVEDVGSVPMAHANSRRRDSVPKGHEGSWPGISHYDYEDITEGRTIRRTGERLMVRHGDSGRLREDKRRLRTHQ